MKEKIKLYGFNNLTKALSFNIYDICITETEKDRQEYIEYIDEMYNANRLTEILVEVTNRIGASVLNVSKQDYDPQGASVTILISEEEVSDIIVDKTCNRGIFEKTPETVLAHLDKSHITVHTYPESHPGKGVSTFRVDIDVATCGEISPLNTLNYLISCFDSDIITVDYRVRGFTRDNDGQKHFIDHKIDSIEDFIEDETLERYKTKSFNFKQERLYHERMMIEELKLENYLFNTTVDGLSDDQKEQMIDDLRLEMSEIFNG